MLDLQKVAGFLSAQKGLNKIEVCCCRYWQMNTPKAQGEFEFRDNLYIRINTDECKSDKDELETVFHEWRHYWQYYRYHDHFMWWMKNNKKWYKMVYHTILCTIEEDARLFGCSLGQNNAEYLLQKSQNQLKHERYLFLPDPVLSDLEVRSSNACEKVSNQDNTQKIYLELTKLFSL